MKGLLKNNLYAALSSAKIFAAAMIFFGIFVIAVISQPLLIGYMMLSMVGFSIISISSLQKENVSKWSKYKLTTPIRRIDIIKSYFVSQLIWLIIGIAVAMIAMGLSILLHGFPFDRSIDILMLITLGMSVSLLMNAIFFPLHYLGDGEKSEAFLIISLFCAIGIVMGGISFLNWIFGSNITIFQLLIGIVIIIVCAVMSFIISFPLTILAFKRKEY